MKNTIRIALISATLAAGGAYAAPFMAIGDGAELFLTGQLGVRADDNIYTAKKAESDLIFDIAPGIDLTFGKDSQLKGSLTLADTFVNYSDNSKLNTNLFAGDFLTRYDDGKLKLGFNVGFHELNQNSVDVRPTVGSTPSLTRRDIFSAGGNAEVEISQITSIGAGVAFSHENYKTPASRGFTDSDSLTVPIDFYYKWTPKLDLSAGYRYRDYRVNIGSDSTDHFFNVGARGEFSPKLTGKFAIGLNTRKLDRGGDESSLGLDSSVAYEVSAKTSIQVGMTNDFGTSPQGQQQKNFTLNGMVTSKISEEWSVNAGLSWRAIEYTEVPAITTTAGTPAVVTIVRPRVAGRTDDFFEGTLGTTYIINSNVRLVGSYTYRNYSSDIASSEFKQNVFSVAANFRY